MMGSIKIRYIIVLYWCLLSMPIGGQVAYIQQDSHWVAVDTAAFGLDDYRADEAFSYTQRQPSTSWLQRMIDSWLQRWRGAEEGSTFTSWSVIRWALVLGAIASICYFIYRQRRAVGIEEDHTLSMAEEIATRSEQDVEALLQKALDTDDGKMAIRYLLISSMQYLTRRGHMQYRTDETNYQLLRQLRDQPKWQKFISTVIDRYEHVWFGHYGMDSAAVETLRADFESMKSGNA